jgi:hypothetical protein
MKLRSILLAAIFVATTAYAAAPNDYAQQWPLAERTEGAWAIRLEEAVYRQVQSPNLSDLAAFNDAGENLPFGPMPFSFQTPPSVWRESAWFALPTTTPAEGGDLQLHISRNDSGQLALDASLSHPPQTAVGDVLIDVRGQGEVVDAIALGLTTSAADFSTEISIDASDDLSQWRTVVPSATVAQLRQSGQSLVRRHVEFAPIASTYLRLHALSAGNPIPLATVQLRFQSARASSPPAQRRTLTAEFIGRDGPAYLYRMPARIPVERVNILLGEDNVIADFSISAREPSDRYWSYLGQMGAFRLRGAGLALDNEAMDVPQTRARMWRIEPRVTLTKPPVLEFMYQPEDWLLLTHGRAVYRIVAGSGVAQREEFPLDALIGQVRAHYGRDWQPPVARLGPMSAAGGESALTRPDPARTRRWLLWGVLLLGAGAIVAMVLMLLRNPSAPGE